MITSLGSSEEYAKAKPFPHAAMDMVFPADLVRKAEQEFPAPDHTCWFRFGNNNEKKLACEDPKHIGPNCRELLNYMCSPAFVKEVEVLTGIKKLVPNMHGGGMHQIVPGGFLEIHADFNRHAGFYRRLNCLLFLNSAWRTDWGGDLELWDSAGPVRMIIPAANRLVIFTTSDSSFHGHPYPLKCPPGKTRKSLAVYFFTQVEPTAATPDHSTLFIDHTKESPPPAASRPEPLGTDFPLKLPLE